MKKNIITSQMNSVSIISAHETSNRSLAATAQSAAVSRLRIQTARSV